MTHHVATVENENGVQTKVTTPDYPHLFKTAMRVLSDKDWPLGKTADAVHKYCRVAIQETYFEGRTGYEFPSHETKSGNPFVVDIEFIETELEDE